MRLGMRALAPWISIRTALVGLVKKTGLRSDHLAIPSYYLPYLFLDGLAAKAPVSCDFEVTYRCNMYCDMCPQVAYRNRSLEGRQIRHPINDPSRRELSTEELKKAISDLAQGGTKVVQFTGGEAFLRKDLCDVLEHAKSCRLEVSVLTNGSLIRRETAEHLVRVGVDTMSISLDGAKELHERIRHLPGAFDQIRDALGHIHAEKIRQNSTRPRLALACVIQHQNQDSLADIVDAAKHIGVSHLSFNLPFYTTPELELATRKILGPAFVSGAKPEEQSDLTSHHGLSADRIRRQLSEARRRASDHGITISTSPSLPDDEVQQYIDDPVRSVAQRCFYPWKAMRVNAWGDVYPCSVDAHLGNIRDDGILHVWNGEKYCEFRRMLKDVDLFPQCAKCCALNNRIWNRLGKFSLRASKSVSRGPRQPVDASTPM